MNKLKKIEKIEKALAADHEVYIHPLGNIGNGMRITKDRCCYLSKYPYDELGAYYGQWDGSTTNGTLDRIDGRRRIEIL